MRMLIGLLFAGIIGSLVIGHLMSTVSTIQDTLNAAGL